MSHNVGQTMCLSLHIHGKYSTYLRNALEEKLIILEHALNILGPHFQVVRDNKQLRNAMVRYRGGQ